MLSMISRKASGGCEAMKPVYAAFANVIRHQLLPFAGPALDKRTCYRPFVNVFFSCPQAPAISDPLESRNVGSIP